MEKRWYSTRMSHLPQPCLRTHQGSKQDSLGGALLTFPGPINLLLLLEGPGPSSYVSQEAPPTAHRACSTPKADKQSEQSFLQHLRCSSCL